MPMIRKHPQICKNSHRCEYGFSSPSPEKELSRINCIKDGLSSKPGVRIGSIDSSGFRLMLVGLAYYQIGVEFMLNKKEKKRRSKRLNV
jgi:hypothetical protein